MILGFTGTSTKPGMTQEQRHTLWSLMKQLQPREFHHGCCVEADAQAHIIALGLAVPIVGHPCTITHKTAMLSGFKLLYKPKDPLDRNRDIVADSTKIIACPSGMVERKRGSGTWATIRYSRKAGNLLCIIAPDGSLYELSESLAV